jgi:hypothetical protein
MRWSAIRTAFVERCVVPSVMGRRARWAGRLAGRGQRPHSQAVSELARRQAVDGVGMVCRAAESSAELLGQLQLRRQGGAVLNTSYIERLNGTFRSRLASLGRRIPDTLGVPGVARDLRAGMCYLSNGAGTNTNLRIL